MRLLRMFPIQRYYQGPSNLFYTESWAQQELVCPFYNLVRTYFKWWTNLHRFDAHREVYGEHKTHIYLRRRGLCFAIIQFIKLLTGDPNIVIGHDPESQTAEVGTHFYLNPQSGIFATLVDTPGFDDSRDGVTDTDILEKIVQFLQSE